VHQLQTDDVILGVSMRLARQGSARQRKARQGKARPRAHHDDVDINSLDWKYKSFKTLVASCSLRAKKKKNYS